MLTVPTLLGASYVPVTKDTLEMEELVMVSYFIALIINLTLNQILMSVWQVWTMIVIPLLTVPTLLGTTPVPVTKDTQEME